MVAVAVLAFTGILVSLAVGQVAVAGACAVVLVVIWFVLRSIQRRDGRA